MKSAIRIITTGLALYFLVSLCALHAQNKGFYGTWATGQSSVEMEFSIAGGALSIKAIDTNDGEELQVSDIKVVSDKVISLTLFTPSTNWTIQSVFHLQSKKLMKEQILKEGEDDIWLDYSKKKK